ncbi:MAG: rhodanese-like domain-containing protein [Cytophagales bacterium]|nr:rhodanese-like domain-containing protein [Cytophagales bacterium]
MLELLKSLFGIGPRVNFKELVQNGAAIVDVRTKGEYSQGHIKGSVNIPLGSPVSQYARFPKNKVLITCCASGMRSGQAKSTLKSSGYTDVHNGGGWGSLEYKLR